MGKIKEIIATEIINSRGYPTIGAKLILDDGLQVETSIPSGETLFDYQTKELKDNDPNRFNGFGVRNAVYYINQLIAPKLKGVSIEKQYEIDSWLVKADGTENKSKLGVNTLITISYLITKAAAFSYQQPLFQYINSLYKKITGNQLEFESLPSPIFSILKGGRHGQVNLDFREFQIIPSSAYSYSKAYELGVDLYHLLRHLYKFNFSYNLDVLTAIKNSLEKKELSFGKDVFLGIDFGASFYFSGRNYSFKDKDQPIPSDEYYTFLLEVIKKHSPFIITDCFAHEDWSNWIKLSSNIVKEIYLVGDDLIGSNKARLEKAINQKAVSTVILRPNQIGTISETILLVDFLRKNQISYIFASDLGETSENLLADLSVGLASDFVSFGAPVHAENVSKYNRLLEIEKELNG